jgi:hypothetical protein
VAAGKALPVHVHHDGLHAGTAGDALRNAGHFPVPTAPLTPWKTCGTWPRPSPSSQADRARGRGWTAPPRRTCACATVPSRVCAGPSDVTAGPVGFTCAPSAPRPPAGSSARGGRGRPRAPRRAAVTRCRSPL